MSIDQKIELRKVQLSKVRHLDTIQQQRTIQITSSSEQKNMTLLMKINQGEFNAIEGILLHPLAPSPSLNKMDAYELFMNLQMWSLETFRNWLQNYDQNGEYLDDPENGFVFTREYAINTIFRFLILDNQ